MQVLSISTYDYSRNTCLHYIYELELVPYRPSYNCLMMNMIQQVTNPMPTNLSYIVLAELLLQLLLLHLATKLLLSLLLLLLLSLLLSKLSNYFATDHFAVDN